MYFFLKKFCLYEDVSPSTGRNFLEEKIQNLGIKIQHLGIKILEQGFCIFLVHLSWDHIYVWLQYTSTDIILSIIILMFLSCDITTTKFIQIVYIAIDMIWSEQDVY